MTQKHARTAACPNYLLEPGPRVGEERPVQGRRDRDTTPVAASGIEPLDDVMRRHIETALHATQGRVEGPHGAARLLRINPHTLRARMRKLKINWRDFRI